MAASESPFDRRGARVEGTARAGRPIRPGHSVYRVAHEALGEWRQWRELLELNAVADPFDLEGRDQTGAGAFVFPFALVDGSGEADEDLSAELGVAPRVVWATPELEGTGELLVEDTDVGAYALRFRAPGEQDAGGAVAVADADLAEADGQPRAIRPLLTSASGRYAVDLELDPDAWLVCWLARCVPLTLAPARRRTELLVPG